MVFVLTVMIKDLFKAEKIEPERLYLGRLFLLIGAIAIIFFSHLYSLISDQPHLLFWDRYAMATICLVTLGLTFWEKIPEKFFGTIISLTIDILYPLHVFYILFNSNFDKYYVIIALIIIQAVFLLQDNKKAVVAFFLYITTLSACFLLASPDIFIGYRWFVFTTILASSFASMAIANSRLEDILRSKKNEENLEKSESLMASLIESTADYIWSIDREMKLVSFNSAFRKVIEEATSKEVMHGLQMGVGFSGLASSKDWKEYYEEALSGIRCSEEIEVKVGNRKICIHANFNPIRQDGNIIGVSIFGRDITNKKNRETEIIRLQQAIESTNEAITITDLEGTFIYQNPAFKKLCGYTLGELNMVGLARIFTSKEKTSEIIVNCLHGRTWEGELVMLDRSGEEIEIYMKASSVWDRSGKVIGMMAIHSDISEKKRMEEALRLSEERYALAMQGSNDGLWDWNLLTNEVYFSPRWKAIIGYEDHELPNSLETWEQYMHPEDRDYMLSQVKKHFSGELPVYTEEFRMIHKDGHEVWILTKGKATLDENGVPIRMSGFHSDITERKNTEALLTGVMESSLSGIMTLEAARDDNGTITDFVWTMVNEAAGKIRPILNEDVLGKRTLEVISKEEWVEIFDSCSQVVETGIPLEMEYKMPLKNGKTRWIHLIVVKLEDGVAITFEDIDEKKKAEKQLQMLSLVADKTDNGVVITDNKGRIEWVNDGFCRISGYELKEIRGKKPGSFLQGSGTDPDTVLRIREKIMRGESFQEEVLNYHKDGTPYWISMSITPIFDKHGKVKQFFAVENDITERIKVEQDLKSAKEAAEAAAIAKSEFLATMSHEIRTPMNAVIGMTGLLLETELNDEQRDYVETVRNSGDNLLTVINDILDFSKIESGKLELETQAFDLAEIVEDVLDLLANNAAEKGLELFYHIDPNVPEVIHSDPTRLGQVLVNLINNGLKFTEVGEVELYVRLASTQRDTAEIEFSVRDTGIGIPKEKINRLFKSFSQIDASTTRKYGGTGLGLAISQNLVNLMGGDIWIESKPGRGSTFYFTISVSLPSKRPQQKLPGFDFEQAKKAVVIDDNPAHLEILSHTLTSWGIENRGFTDPGKAIQFMQASSEYDICIIDKYLSRMAPQIARKIVALKGKDFPIVFISNIGDSQLPGVSPSEFALARPVRRQNFHRLLGQLLGASGAQPDSDSIKSLEGKKARNAMQEKLKILLVEDNTVNQKVALRLLLKLGYQADIAGNGIEAIKALELKKYDLIFMDMQMPEMDGIEATREIRRRWEGSDSNPIIIAMTANAMQGDRERCIEAGMDDYISKPVKLEKVEGAISQWFFHEKQESVI